MPDSIPYKSFCWSFGTTSFRTKNFNKTIEEQLLLLEGFWQLPENQNKDWSANIPLQTRYYDYMQEKGFVEGNASNKPKDAREKTSGLADIGLIDSNRRLTNAGRALRCLCDNNDFESDNFFGIAKDSYIYLKQLLKTASNIEGEIIRPFIILLDLLAEVDTLSMDEFTYLLPLCTTKENTDDVVKGIYNIRNGLCTIDDFILQRLLSMENYREALELFLSQKVDEDLLCEVGLNRKSRAYDKVYFQLYKNLYSFYVNGDTSSFSDVYESTKSIKLGKWWRAYLFNTTSERAISRNPSACKKITIFDSVATENEFKVAFFKIMHLFKAKATLSDYLDLNRRYIKTTDIVLFEDNVVKLDIVPKHFFNSVIEELYQIAYQKCDKLNEDCPISQIADCLKIDETHVIDGVNAELGTTVTTIAEARSALEDNRYARLHHLINTKFTDDKILTLLDCFETRNDATIRAMVTDNADIPTIFEYVLAILWYKVSEFQGNVLNYMKLSLDVDLLPKTHASGGEADIVYEYSQTDYYPPHTLLIEATLADSTNQRRMEMEPVSRHLGQHLIKTSNKESYCVFATNSLNINVVSDFRGRKNMPYYDSQDYSRYVDGMKIIPIEVSELKEIVSKNKRYKDLYDVFDKAFHSTMPPHLWYDSCIKKALA